MAILLTAGGALLVGFLAGLLTSRRASRWCPSCGLVLHCPAGHPGGRRPS